MRTDYTYDNWIKYFDDLEKAKKYANKDYNKGKKIKIELSWKKENKDYYRTLDLSYVMYHIEKIKVENNA